MGNSTKKCSLPYGFIDFVVLLFLFIVGLLVPVIINFQPLHMNFPGYVDNINFTHPDLTTIYQSKAFLKNPFYAKPHLDTSQVTIDDIELFILVFLMPFVAVTLYLFVLIFLTKMRDYKGTMLTEFVSFTYVYAIAMSITIWATKALNVLLSSPRPDFYERCEIDYSNINNIHCKQENSEDLYNCWFSFPSGHSSYMFSVATMLTLFAWSKINIIELEKEFLNEKWDFKIIVDFIATWPLWLACYVAGSRVNDFAHTTTDIVGGLAIGWLAGMVGYYSQYSKESSFSNRSNQTEGVSKSIKIFEDDKKPKEKDIELITKFSTDDKNLSTNDENKN